MVLSLWPFMLLCCYLLHAYSWPLGRSDRKSPDMYEGGTQNDKVKLTRRETENTTEPTDSFERDCRTNTLCAEGIANIVVGGVAFIFLVCLALAMYNWEVQADRKARIRMAIARNQQIDRQIEEAKQRQQQMTETILEGTMSGEEEKTVGVETQQETDDTILLTS